MFCVIQTVPTRKPDKRGYPKELLSKYMQMSINGEDHSHYYYSYSDERFERPIKPSYRITIHQSYREQGKPKKQQFYICTVSYYDLATGFFSLYDWGYSRIEIAADALKASQDEIYDLIDNKLEPLEERIRDEFQQTDEYRAHEEHERVTTIYAAKKAQFNEKWGVGGYEYDKCYDVFGELKNPEYLEKIKRDYEARQDYEEKSRSYRERFYNNYSSGYSSSGYGSYQDSLSNNYTDAEQLMLKQFYRTLSKKFHPDVNPDKDTSEEMQLLNKLKSQWGL